MSHFGPRNFSLISCLSCHNADKRIDLPVRNTPPSRFYLCNHFSI